MLFKRKYDKNSGGKGGEKPDIDKILSHPSALDKLEVIAEGKITDFFSSKKNKIKAARMIEAQKGLNENKGAALPIIKLFEKEEDKMNALKELDNAFRQIADANSEKFATNALALAASVIKQLKPQDKTITNLNFVLGKAIESMKIIRADEITYAFPAVQAILTYRVKEGCKLGALDILLNKANEIVKANGLIDDFSTTLEDYFLKNHPNLAK